MSRHFKRKEERLDAFGERLARLRRERGLTQVEIANRLGVTQPVISQYERGEVRLHDAMIVRLSRVLRVSSDELLGLKPIGRNGGPRNPRWGQRLEQIDRLRPKDRLTIARMIDGFLAGRGTASHARG